MVELETEAIKAERAFEQRIGKARTGNPELDWLMLGGIPFGSNILVCGPESSGKKVLASQFAAQGLWAGVPVVWMVTDQRSSDIKTEMTHLLQDYCDYEELGRVKYVETHPLEVKAKEGDENTVRKGSPEDFRRILENADRIAGGLKEKHEYYRMIFRNLTTMAASTEHEDLFKFLQSFAGKRKRDGAVSLYLVDKGMHSDTFIQMIGSTMDGTIEFKVGKTENHLRLRGIGDVQTREWLRYTHSKRGIGIEHVEIFPGR